MSVREFAAYERILGNKIMEVRGQFWQEVRPFLFRPLCALQPFAPCEVNPPFTGRLGGFQYVVSDPGQANSVLNALLFDQPKQYSLNSLDYNRKRQVKLAMKQFEIKPVTDRDEFKKAGYRAYLSFYERTQYNYGSERRDENRFREWADSLFSTPNLLILGAWNQGVLRGVSVSMIVDKTFRYATFFCDSEALRLFLADLMLHSVREIAAGQDDVSEIFVGMYKGLKGLDDFYLLRGCKIVSKPALLRLNPVLVPVLHKFFPGKYQKLVGAVPFAPRSHETPAAVHTSRS